MGEEVESDCGVGVRSDHSGEVGLNGRYCAQRSSRIDEGEEAVAAMLKVCESRCSVVVLTVVKKKKYSDAKRGSL